MRLETPMTLSTHIVATAYGDPTEVLSAVEAELPAPGPGQVAVEVRAAGVNPMDLKIVTGFMGTDELKLPRRLGLEVAGVVTAIGDGVEPAVGDEVIVYPAAGGYTDRLIAEASSVHTKPAELDFEHAAGLLLVGGTAADLVATAGVGSGDVVLIHGGAGAVGTIAVQLAVRAGASVIATASPANHTFLAGLGAVPVAYGPGLLDRVTDAATGPVTASVDTVGTDEAIDTSLALHAADRIVSIAAFGRADDGIVLLDGSTADSKRHRSDAAAGLIADAASGTLVTEVAKTFDLRDAGQALGELGRSHPRGKFILLP